MDTVLDNMVLVFRERGYHATSVGDLSSATGLTTGSLYKAFEDKRGIFLAAFERYVDLRTIELQHLLDAQPNGLDKIRAMLRFYAESSHGSEGRRGCLVVSSATAVATFDQEMATKIVATVRRTESVLRTLLQQGVKDGSISSDIHVPAMAGSLLALLHGLRLTGKTGRTRHDMLATVEQSLRMLI